MPLQEGSERIDAAFRVDLNWEKAGLPIVEESIDCFNLDFWFLFSFLLLGENSSSPTSYISNKLLYLRLEIWLPRWLN